MKNDTIHHQFDSYKKRLAALAKITSAQRHQLRPETQGDADASLMDDAHEMFERIDLDGSSEQAKAKHAMALLKQARDVIVAAENKIKTQKKRIRQLEELSTTDELTGLTNRRGFFDAFRRELDRCERKLSDGGLLVVIDVDNFKTTNDTYGHLAGDACLKLLAQVLKSEIRVMDVAARMGGDEFVLLFANVEKDAAMRRVQDMVQRLNKMSLIWQGREIPLNVSLGIKTFKGGDHLEHIFDEADQRLYAQKAEKKKDDESLSSERRT